jgi:hypothetical protein
LSPHRVRRRSYTVRQVPRCAREGRAARDGESLPIRFSGRSRSQDRHRAATGVSLRSNSPRPSLFS